MLAKLGWKQAFYVHRPAFSRVASFGHVALSRLPRISRIAQSTHPSVEDIDRRLKTMYQAPGIPQFPVRKSCGHLQNIGDVFDHTPLSLRGHERSLQCSRGFALPKGE